MHTKNIILHFTTFTKVAFLWKLSVLVMSDEWWMCRSTTYGCNNGRAWEFSLWWGWVLLPMGCSEQPMTAKVCRSLGPGLHQVAGWSWTSPPARIIFLLYWFSSLIYWYSRETLCTSPLLFNPVLVRKLKQYSTINTNS